VTTRIWNPCWRRRGDMQDSKPSHVRWVRGLSLSFGSCLFFCLQTFQSSLMSGTAFGDEIVEPQIYLFNDLLLLCEKKRDKTLLKYR
jgi:hypothetical protein